MYLSFVYIRMFMVLMLDWLQKNSQNGQATETDKITKLGLDKKKGETWE